MWVKWRLVSFCLDIVFTLVQNRCKDGDERTIGLEIILGSKDGTPR
jgi:hypothetical protein